MSTSSEPLLGEGEGSAGGRRIAMERETAASGRNPQRAQPRAQPTGGGGGGVGGTRRRGESERLGTGPRRRGGRAEQHHSSASYSKGSLLSVCVCVNELLVGVNEL